MANYLHIALRHPRVVGRRADHVGQTEGAGAPSDRWQCWATGCKPGGSRITTPKARPSPRNAQTAPAVVGRDQAPAGEHDLYLGDIVQNQPCHTV